MTLLLDIIVLTVMETTNGLHKNFNSVSNRLRRLPDRRAGCIYNQTWLLPNYLDLEIG